MKKVTIPEGEFGPWKVERFTVPETSVEQMRLAFSGRNCPPGEYTKLIHNTHGLMMSDTQAEMRDHSYFVHKANGRVLINGLGIGMCLGAVLEKPDVEHVRVIEVCPHLIDWVAPHYTDSRVEIVCADALEYRPPKGERFNAVWHDIWPAITTDNLPEYTKLKRRYGRRADWQGCWAEGYLRRYAA